MLIKRTSWKAGRGRDGKRSLLECWGDVNDASVTTAAAAEQKQRAVPAALALGRDYKMWQMLAMPVLSKEKALFTLLSFSFAFALCTYVQRVPYCSSSTLS